MEEGEERIVRRLTSGGGRGEDCVERGRGMKGRRTGLNV